MNGKPGHVCWYNEWKTWTFFVQYVNGDLKLNDNMTPLPSKCLLDSYHQVAEYDRDEWSSDQDVTDDQGHLPYFVLIYVLQSTLLVTASFLVTDFSRSCCWDRCLGCGCSLALAAIWIHKGELSARRGPQIVELPKIGYDTSAARGTVPTGHPIHLSG